MPSNYLIHLLLLEVRVGGGLQVASVPQNHTQRDQQLPSKCARNLHMSLHRTRIAAYLPCSFSPQLHLCRWCSSFLPSVFLLFSDAQMFDFKCFSLSLSCPSVLHSTALLLLSGTSTSRGAREGNMGKECFRRERPTAPLAPSE